MLRRGLLSAGIVATAGLLAAGCSSDSAPKLPSLPEITGSLAPATRPVVGPPTDIYARVAREVMSCWFGPNGPLKAGYVFHGEADPPSRGGKAIIVIHERDPSSDNPRGLRAFRIAILPSGETSEVSVENLKLAEPLARTMEADVHRWVEGAIGCADSGGGWDAEPPKDPQAPKHTPKAKPGRSA